MVSRAGAEMKTGGLSREGWKGAGACAIAGADRGAGRGGFCDEEVNHPNHHHRKKL